MSKEIVACRPKALPSERAARAAQRAFHENPANRPAVEGLLKLEPKLKIDRLRLAASRTHYWGGSGVKLTVSFLDGQKADLRTRILSHMNAWSRTANVAFTETQSDGHVRISCRKGDGHWSYLGTDILEIPLNEPTMNLDAFTMQTDDAEFYRVVRHEAGHTLGFVHEHLRRELVARIDREAAIKYFGDHYGWSAEEVEAQVLTALEDSSLLGTSTTDARSIMCYQLPASLTKDREPIIGGTDIDPDDFAMAAKLYPKPRARCSPRSPRRLASTRSSF